jgi:hypothetical protein
MMPDPIAAGSIVHTKYSSAATADGLLLLLCGAQLQSADCAKSGEPLQQTRRLCQAHHGVQHLLKILQSDHQ